MFENVFLILLIDYHMIFCFWICLIRLKKNFLRLRKDFFKLDYINKLVDMSQSDHMTVFNENSVNKIYLNWFHL